MLRLLRDGAQSKIIKFALFSMLGMALVGLALMDFSGTFRNGVKVNSIAKVGGDDISIIEFENSVTSMLRRSNLQREEAYNQGQIYSLLQGEIQSRLFDKASQDMGIMVPDQVVAKKIRDILKPLTEQGIDEDQALNQLLFNQGISEAMLVNSFKQQVASEQLLESIIAGTHVPKQLINDAYRYRHEERKAQFFKISINDIKDIAKPSDEELKDFYKTISDEYMVPEYRAIHVAIIDESIVEDSVSFDDEVLQDTYDERIEDFHTAEQRRIQQAVLGSEEIAQSVYKKILKTKDLKKAVADTKSSMSFYLAAQNYSKADLETKKLGKAVDSIWDAKEGTIMEPIETDLGWQVIWVEKIIPENTISFEDAKVELAATLKEEELGDLLYETINEIEDRLAGYESPISMIEEYGLIAQETAEITRTQKDRSNKSVKLDLQDWDKIVETAFLIEGDETGRVIETSDGNFALVYIGSTTTAHVKLFKNVKDEILKRWIDGQKINLARDKSREAIAKLNEGETLPAVAATAKKSFTTTPLLKRASNSKDSDLEAGFIPTLFGIDKMNGITSLPVSDGVIVMSLVEQKIPEIKEDGKENEDMQTLSLYLKRSMQDDILEQYKQALISEYGVKVNDAAFQAMYAPQE